MEKDFRLLVINNVIRRQLEALEAALDLASANLGHLSVSFIRPSLEEMLWVKLSVELGDNYLTKAAASSG
jgi:hypothetical protein